MKRILLIVLTSCIVLDLFVMWMLWDGGAAQRDRAERPCVLVARRQAMAPVPAFTKRQQMLSPDQYEIMVARTSYGVRQAMLFELLAFSKSVLDQFWL